MPNDDNSEENVETSEDVRARLKDEQLEKDGEDEAEFHPHMGKILQIKPYTSISSLSWDKSYDNPTGTSNVELHYSNDDVNKVMKYVYKGVSCKVKIRRSTDGEFKPSYIEEYGLDEDGIRLREHYPTKEQRLESEIEYGLDYLINENEETTVDDLNEVAPKTRSDNDAGLYGFVTDVTHKQNGIELEIKDWGYALEDKTKELSFVGRMRSQIMTEVIKSYGLVPVVDFTGLRDDIISWTNLVQNEEMTSGDDKILGNDAIEVGNSLASMYGFCAKSGSEDYATMKSKGCGSCWAWSDALYTELTKIGYTCRIVEYPTSQSSNHRSVQYKQGGQWIDYPYRSTNIPQGAHSTSASASGTVIVGGD